MADSKKTFTDAEALDFHRLPTPGKISILPTKPMATQRDLSLAYSPGVAVPVKAIAENPKARASSSSALQTSIRSTSK
jgi:malate dehydrogenase (oxaloacetate-decarboxylating)(NADP+)